MRRRRRAPPPRPSQPSRPPKPTIRPRPPRPPAPSESQIQRACVGLLQALEALGHLAYCHVPNGYLSRKACCAAVGMGLRAGVPDLLVWLKGGRSLAVELKSARGVVSDAQQAWHDRLRTLGHSVYVVRSVDELAVLLTSAGVPAMGLLVPLSPAKARAAA